MVTSLGCPDQSTADPHIHTANGCPVLHWDVLNFYVLGLPCKPQSSHLGKRCVIHHLLFHLSLPSLY